MPSTSEQLENLTIKRKLARRLMAVLISAALLLMFSAFYSWCIFEQRVNIPTVCLTGGTLVIVIAMSIDVLLVRSDLAAQLTAQTQPATETPPALPTRQERLTQETNANQTELLRTLNLLRDITPRRGSFGPRMECTIVKDDVARPGFFVPASAPSYVGQPNNPNSIHARRRPQLPLPLAFLSSPSGPGPYPVYLEETTDEIFYDNPVPVNQGAQPKPDAKQQAMGQTAPSAPVQSSLRIPVETEVTIEAPPPELREQPSTVPSGADRGNHAATAAATTTTMSPAAVASAAIAAAATVGTPTAATGPKSTNVGRDEPDFATVLRELIGLPPVPPVNTTHDAPMRTERRYPMSYRNSIVYPPVSYGYDNVNAAQVEQAEEAIYEDPDILPQRQIFVFDDMPEEEDSQPEHEQSN